MSTDLEKNLGYAARLHAEDPKGFKELLVQLKAFEPTMMEFMELAMSAPAPTPLDTPTYEALEELSIELDNVGSRLRELMQNGKGSMTMAVILESLKGASRLIQDAADDLLRLTQGGI